MGRPKLPQPPLLLQACIGTISTSTDIDIIIIEYTCYSCHKRGGGGELNTSVYSMLAIICMCCPRHRALAAGYSYRWMYIEGLAWYIHIGYEYYYSCVCI